MPRSGKFGILDRLFYMQIQSGRLMNDTFKGIVLGLIALAVFYVLRTGLFYLLGSLFGYGESSTAILRLSLLAGDLVLAVAFAFAVKAIRTNHPMRLVFILGVLAFILSDLLSIFGII